MAWFKKLIKFVRKTARVAESVAEATTPSGAAVALAVALAKETNSDKLVQISEAIQAAEELTKIVLAARRETGPGGKRVTKREWYAIIDACDNVATQIAEAKAALELD